MSEASAVLVALPTPGVRFAGPVRTVEDEREFVMPKMVVPEFVVPEGKAVSFAGLIALVDCDPTLACFLAVDLSV